MTASFGVVEADLMAPLVAWLQRRGQIRAGSHVAEELPWSGRRVDMAVLSKHGRSSAFELKINHTRRVLEQSSLNTLAFDRSYMVTATRPTVANLEQARSLGVGVVHISLDTGRATLISAPRPRSVHPAVRGRIRRAILARSSSPQG